VTRKMRFLAHAKRHIELETPLIVLENVQDTFWLRNLILVFMVLVLFL